MTFATLFWQKKKLQKCFLCGELIIYKKIVSYYSDTAEFNENSSRAGQNNMKPVFHISEDGSKIEFSVKITLRYAFSVASRCRDKLSILERSSWEIQQSVDEEWSKFENKPRSRCTTATTLEKWVRTSCKVWKKYPQSFSPLDSSMSLDVQ
jgi:hypothetical protein